jgi:hypothetical protein
MEVSNFVLSEVRDMNTYSASASFNLMFTAWRLRILTIAATCSNRSQPGIPMIPAGSGARCERMDLMIVSMSGF